MTYATRLGGVHFSGEDTVLLVTGLTADTTFNIPFTGKGEVRMFNNTKALLMEANNSAYMGAFVISNSPITYRNQRCLGTRLSLRLTQALPKAMGA